MYFRKHILSFLKLEVEILVMCIRQRRQAMKMTQGELGDSMGVTCSCVNNWEQEVALPKTRQLPLLAAVLDCSIDDLFTQDARSASSISA